jgi:hypothetical protein
MVHAPRLEPWSNALFQVSDDLVRDPAVNVFEVFAHLFTFGLEGQGSS